LPLADGDHQVDEGRGAQADEGIGAQAAGFVSPLPLGADDATSTGATNSRA
jgi:hypothetical protein